MEWVETTGKSLDDAKERALDLLGVDERDAEFEILDEPRPGLFGRVRGEARVRARVRPTTPRPKAERRDRKRKSDTSEGAPTVTTSSNGESRPTAEPTAKAPAASAPAASAPAGEHGGDAVDTATAFLSGLAEAFGAEGTVTSAPEGDGVEVSLDGDDLGLLIGPRGATLQAVQDLVRVVVAKGDGDQHPARIRVDIGRYRLRRREALARFATKVADEVRESGTARALEPMSAPDRKVVHDTVNGLEGVATRSEGDDPFRRVVIVPVGDA